MANSGDASAGRADATADAQQLDELMTDDAPKVDADNPSSLCSSPEPSTAAASAAGPPDQQPPPKRKGGRKPMYATSEERKQRNREAQAAFRERRSEYIKQLEATIKQHEDALRSLQQNHRSAADECLMLRYKNSLLERILLEKGIDVQAELQVKASSPVFDAAQLAPQMPAPMLPTSLQRNNVRQQARRSYQSVRAGSPSATQYMPRSASLSGQSPITQTTPSSHASSPTAMSNRSSTSVSGGLIPSPAPASIPQGPTQPSLSNAQHAVDVKAPRRAISTSNAGPGSSASSSGMARSQAASRPQGLSLQQRYAYPTQFQKHIDQLGKSSRSFLTELYNEYDTPQLDDYDPDQHQISQQDFDGQECNMPDFPPHTELDPAARASSMQHGSSRVRAEAAQPTQSAGRQPDLNQYDPMLDADPFGLTASMHFPTNYSFDLPPGK